MIDRNELKEDDVVEKGDTLVATRDRIINIMESINYCLTIDAAKLFGFEHGEDVVNGLKEKIEILK